jgi:chromosome segregation ATPase
VLEASRLQIVELGQQVKQLSRDCEAGKTQLYQALAQSARDHALAVRCEDQLVEVELEAKDSERAAKNLQEEYDNLSRQCQNYQDGEAMEREMEEKDAALKQAKGELASLRASVKAEAMQIKASRHEVSQLFYGQNCGFFGRLSGVC